MPEVTQPAHRWVGRPVFDQAGEDIGHIEDVYLERTSHRPAWLLISSGRLFRHRSFVPITGSLEAEDGVHVPFPASAVTNAPDPSSEATLTPEDERALYRHYGLPVEDTAQETGTEGHVRIVPRDGRLPAEMVRSEEELETSTVLRPAEVVRVRKVVVTEEVNLTVSLQHEELRVERIPITAEVTEADLQALHAHANTVEVAELVLLEEQPVVSKRVVPKERIRLSKGTVTEERQVSEGLRKEHIAIDEESTGDQ